MAINNWYRYNNILISRVSILLTLVLLFFNHIAFGQYQQQWRNGLYGTSQNGSNYGEAIAVDKQDNLYVAGYLQNIQTGYDYFLVKYTSNGSIIWSRTYNGTANGNDYAYSLTLDEFGNAYVVGSSSGSGTLKDCVTIKYDSSGNFKWENRYDFGIGKNDFGLIVKLLNNKDIYVLGTSYFDIDETELDFLLIKIDSSGTQNWARRNRGGKQNNYPQKMVLDKFGNIYLAGSSDITMNASDFIILKYKSNGDTLWTRTFDYGHLPNNAYDIVIDSIGNICLTGNSLIYSSDNSYFTTIKYDSSGTLLWYKLYQNNPQNFYDIGLCAGIDNNNNIYTAGYTSVHGTQPNTRDYLIIKYKPDGDTAWIRKYCGPGNDLDWIRSLTIDNQNRVIVTGISFGSGTNADYYTLVYDTLGNTIWDNRYNGAGNFGDLSLFVTLDNMHNIIITGSAYETSTRSEAVTIKYSKTVGINNYNEILPHEISLSQNYPNPFNPRTNIAFSLPKDAKVELMIYDIIGRLIGTLVDDYMKAGSYVIPFSDNQFLGKKLAGGVYFYRLQVNDFVSVKKMVLIK